MDGSDHRFLVNGTNITWPNGLAIDYNKNRIYWADAKTDVVESINLDGTDRKIIISGTRHIFGLAIDAEHIYWTDWSEKSILRAPLKNVSKWERLLTDTGGLMEIQIYDKDLQVGKCLKMYIYSFSKNILQ